MIPEPPLTRREARAREAAAPPVTRREARAAEATQPPTSRRHARTTTPPPTTTPTRREARAAALATPPVPATAPHPVAHPAHHPAGAPAPTRREARGLEVAPREPATPLVGVATPTRRQSLQTTTLTPGTGLTRRELRGGEPRGTGEQGGSRRTTSQLVVDWTACEGRGLCVDLLPELLESDPWGYPKRRDDVPRPDPGTLTEVPTDLAAPAKRAVHLCPRLALRLQ